MKTFITTILCICASCTFALTSGAQDIKRAEVKTVRQRHHQERPPRHHQVMNEKDFQFLYKTIQKKSFDDDRMELLSVGVLDNHFTCQQCIRLMSIFKFDNKKLEMLRIMAGHIVDLENHHDILMRIDFESNRQKAIDILGAGHKKNDRKF